MAPLVFGRDAEQKRIHALLKAARDGTSGFLLLRGEPGIGKTALLESAARRAEGMTVLRATGIELEQELPGAGLHQLLRPCLPLLERLPEPQVAALSSAFGLSSEQVADRFLVYLATLSLLAEASEEDPVLSGQDRAFDLHRYSSEAAARSDRGSRRLRRLRRHSTRARSADRLGGQPSSVLRMAPGSSYIATPIRLQPPGRGSQ